MSTTTAAEPIVCVVLLGNCDGILTDSVAAAVEKRLRVSADDNLAIVRPAAPGGASEEIQRFVERTGANRVLIAGCRLGTAKPLAEAVSRACGLPAAHVRHISLQKRGRTVDAESTLSRDENLVAITTKSIQRGIRALELVGEVETAQFPLSRDVVVLGDGACAARAAAEVSRFGFNTTVISSTGGATDDREYQVVTGALETDTAGYPGSFEVTAVTGSNGSTQKVVFSCGAVIDTRTQSSEDTLATDVGMLFPGQSKSDRVVGLEQLEAEVALLPRTPRERTIAIILDLNTDEPKASTEAACRAALAIQRDRAFQVHLLCRHMRVASPEIGDLYDKAREAGVAVLKYDKKPLLSREAESGALLIQCVDTVLRSEVTLACDVIGVSRHGLASSVSEAYVNNLHFSPAKTAVPGYFLAGAATGEHYGPAALGEAVSAALSVKEFLSPEKLEVELSSATVDEEKCAICLTCIRLCPHLAMQVDSEKNIAKNIPQSCQRCGICVGVCPARAISLPEYSEEVVLAFLD